MLNVVKDEPLFPHIGEYDVTLIGVNIYHTMAHDIQLNVQLNYPYVLDQNMETRYGDPRKLGTILECTKEDEPVFCLCFIVKGNFRPDLQKDYLVYEALENCLKLANVKYKGKRVATTLLGSSRFDGNGDKERIWKIIEENTKDLDITIYDYEQKSRDEAQIETWYAEQAIKERDRNEYYETVRKRKEEAEERFKKNGHRRY